MLDDIIVPFLASRFEYVSYNLERGKVCLTPMLLNDKFVTYMHLFRPVCLFHLLYLFFCSCAGIHSIENSEQNSEKPGENPNNPDGSEKKKFIFEITPVSPFTDHTLDAHFPVQTYTLF